MPLSRRGPTLRFFISPAARVVEGAFRHPTYYLIAERDEGAGALG